MKNKNNLTGEWSKDGRVFSLNGKSMFYLVKCEDENHFCNMFPCECDAMAHFILKALQNGDFQKFYNEYMKS